MHPVKFDIYKAKCIVEAMITAADLRVARARLGEDQSTFAQRLGIDQGTLSRWEREGLPGKGPAQKVAEYLLAELGQLPTEQTEAAE